MTVAVCEKIAGTLGQVDYVEDSDEGSNRGNFMRARITLDIDQPLCRGRKVWLEGTRDHWVSFKFERLPNCCYWCGRVTHGDRDCVLWLQSKGTLPTESQQYGPWLRGDLRPNFRSSNMGGSPSMKRQQTTAATGRGVTRVMGLKEMNQSMGSTSIKLAWKGATDTLTFT